MSIMTALDAFRANCGGRVTCTAARMRYVDGGARQVLEFDGRFPDGRALAIVSEPFAGSPDEMATQIAKELP